ncbi:MAG: hypothetical protein FJ020_05560 [Chloroflexi bacterium]|nr:hypothetical protein [Chloroflexota bacterium]
MNDFTKALDQLEKATSQLVNASIELTERTEKLNRQLQKLVEIVRSHNRLHGSSDSPDTTIQPGGPQVSPPSHEIEILAEVKRLLDGA